MNLFFCHLPLMFIFRAFSVFFLLSFRSFRFCNSNFYFVWNLDKRMEKFLRENDILRLLIRFSVFVLLQGGIFFWGRRLFGRLNVDRVLKWKSFKSFFQWDFKKLSNNLAQDVFSKLCRFECEKWENFIHSFSNKQKFNFKVYK